MAASARASLPFIKTFSAIVFNSSLPFHRDRRHPGTSSRMPHSPRTLSIIDQLCRVIALCVQTILRERDDLIAGTRGRTSRSPCSTFSYYDDPLPFRNSPPLSYSVSVLPGGTDINRNGVPLLNPYRAACLRQPQHPARWSTAAAGGSSPCCALCANGTALSTVCISVRAGLSR